MLQRVLYICSQFLLKSIREVLISTLLRTRLGQQSFSFKSWVYICKSSLNSVGTWNSPPFSLVVNIIVCHVRLYACKGQSCHRKWIVWEDESGSWEVLNPEWKNCQWEAGIWIWNLCKGNLLTFTLWLSYCKPAWVPA